MLDLPVDARARLAECVLWCDQLAALYWTDIEGATSRWTEADGRTRHRQMPERVGSFALCANPSQLLLGLSRSSISIAKR
jgi:L-arabinonolactonase